MIKTFRDKVTAAVFMGEQVRKVPSDVQQRAHAKLRMLDAATNLLDLRVPPANRLEALRGSRKGQHRIRVNDQWRVCFEWRAGDAYGVEFTDYH